MVRPWAASMSSFPSMVPSPAEAGIFESSTSSVAPLDGNWDRKASHAVARNSASLRMSASGTDTASSSSERVGGSSSMRKTPDSQRKTSSSVSRILMESTSRSTRGWTSPTMARTLPSRIRVSCWVRKALASCSSSMWPKLMSSWPRNSRGSVDAAPTALPSRR